MTESKKYEFKRKAIGRDLINQSSEMRMLAKTAADCAGIPFRQVQIMQLKEFRDFMGEFATFNDLNPDDFLGDE